MSLFRAADYAFFTLEAYVCKNLIWNAKKNKMFIIIAKLTLFAAKTPEPLVTFF